MRSILGSILTPDLASRGDLPTDEELRRQLDTTAFALRALLQAAPLGIAIVDRDLRLEFVSPALADMTGAEGSDHAGRPIAEALPGGAPIAALAERVRHTGIAVIEREVELRGALRLTATCYPIQAAGEVVGVGCLLEDRSRRRETHEVLMQLPVPIAVCHGPRHVLGLVNTAWRELFGYGGELGVEVAAALPVATAALVVPRLDEAFASERLLELSDVPVPAGGAPTTSVPGGEPLISSALAAGIPVDPASPRFAHIALQPFRDALGGTSGCLFVCADVTDRVLGRRLLGELMETILIVGLAGGRPPDLNRRWFEYTGVRLGDGSDESWLEVVHPEDRGMCQAALREACELRTRRVVEGRLRRADGEYRMHQLRFAVAPVYSRVVRWFGVFTDVEDARRADLEQREQLAREHAARRDAEAASELKDQFLSSVTHELRTPLAALLLWEKVLRDDPSDPALRTRALDAIRQSALAQSKLVENLLDFTRAAGGQLAVDLRPLLVEGVINAALESAAGEAALRGVVLARGAPLPGVELIADATRIAQTLEIVIGNAIKFSLPGGRIEVGARVVGDLVEIGIADHGLGIAPEYLDRLFDPFSQGDQSLTRMHGGLGLGLKLARRLVELQGGTLVAQSDGVNQGAIFTLSLPFSGGARGDWSGVRPPPLRGARVLVIDDEERVVQALALLLERSGATVWTATSCAAARALLDAARPAAPDVIVCDVGMPVEDGYAFLRALRDGGDEALRTVPAIALTAWSGRRDRDRATTAGFTELVGKPVDIEDLVAAIVRVTGLGFVAR